MNINATLFGQSIAFIVFVWFCAKFIWPHILNALNERKAKIAEGLAAAEEGLKAKERADDEVAAALGEAREQAKEIIANAQKRADQMVDEAKSAARSEGDKLLELAKGDVMFAATGVTSGDMLKGVRYFKGGASTQSIVMRSKSGTIRWIEAEHHFDRKPNYGF